VKTTRINKLLVDLGICSRREADRWISYGRVKIGDRIAKLGEQVSDLDAVFLDGKPLNRAEKPKELWIAYHKPIGIECTGNLDVPESLFRHATFPDRVVYIGRLDKNSSGLLLLTNQTDFVNLMLRSRYGHEKEYLVTTNSPVADADLRKMAQGMDLDDGLGKTLPCQVDRLADNHFRMILTEGRNRQIRRMVEAIGLKVSALKRVRFLTVRLDDLAVGAWRELGPDERSKLLLLVNRFVEKSPG
jgi:23S rRNA pseudouridine2604 synthase